jgi:hypothetical protein
LCSDSKGDVFVPTTVGDYGYIYEYARSASKPIAMLSDDGQDPYGCAGDDGSLERVDFRRDILPKLQGLPVHVIAEAMGCSGSQRVEGTLWDGCTE